MALEAIYRSGVDEIRAVAGAALVDGQILGEGAEEAWVVSAPGGVASGDQYTARRAGIFDVKCASSDTWSAGALLYWDDTNGKAVATKPTTGTFWRLGFALADKTSGQVLNRVLLNARARTEVIEYTVTSDDNTANTVTIPTGFASITGMSLQVRRSGKVLGVQCEATFSRSGGDITVADAAGSTPAGYTLTTSDVLAITVTGY